MTFSAFDQSGDLLASSTSYSVGGGFVVNGESLDMMKAACGVLSSSTPLRASLRAG